LIKNLSRVSIIILPYLAFLMFNIIAILIALIAREL
jgi:hypothetical protein